MFGNPKYNSSSIHIESLFKSLFLEYYEALCYYACKYVNDTDVSQDLVQDVFFDLWKKRDTIDFAEPIKPYLYKATYNKSIDHIRQTRLRNEKLEEPEPGSFLDFYINNMISNAEEELHLKDISREINNCIDNLPPQCKKIFNLSRQTGLKNKEIAEKLDISIKAVEKQISKALNEIRNHLNNKGFSLSILIMIILFFFI